ncbi:MAG: RNA pseudouridine synthase [Planctomycetota bacterium]|nr:MAG: RNA pseudouridine synthase [Planctomycetota bacterium]
MPENPKSESQVIEFCVEAKEAGMRLDKLLATRLEAQSRSYLKELADSGYVQVDGQVTEAKRKLSAGQRCRCELVPRYRLRPGGESELPDLCVLYEDDDLLVVNKPAGMATHPSGGIRWGTLAQVAQAHVDVQLPSSGGEERPGIVHRLDRFTSGVLVLAKSVPALEGLQDQFRERKVSKLYLALVHGEPRFASDWIEDRLERDPGKPERIRIVSRKALREAEEKGEAAPGREAATFYELAERLGGFALLHCRPRTGRTHQIRVHLSSIDHPLLGEHIYKERRHQGQKLPLGAPACKRHMLHAADLEFLHPRSGESLRFSAELPEDFADLLAFLRGRGKRAKS